MAEKFIKFWAELSNRYDSAIDNIMGDKIRPKIRERLNKEDNLGNLIELGCGTGSSTIPILRIFPSGRLIATELSIPMLTILNQQLRDGNYPRNHALMQLNAENLDFQSNTFDLIIGSAILHHLFTPEKTVGKCYDILKPGGICLFFEPFESGFSILSLIYKEILKENRTSYVHKLNKVIVSYLENCIYVWGKMRNQDKTDPFFTNVDDKWAFTKPYFERIAKNYSFNKLIVYPLDKSSRPFENLVKAHSSGNSVEFPHWIWAIVEQYEDNFSNDIKMELLTEGAVIFIK